MILTKIKIKYIMKKTDLIYYAFAIAVFIIGYLIGKETNSKRYELIFYDSYSILFDSKNGDVYFRTNTEREIAKRNYKEIYNNQKNK